MNYAELDPARREPLREGVEKLLAARREAEPIAELPAGLRPATELEAEYMQDVMASLLGEIGGWKVGLPGPGGTPHFCPMPAVGIFARSPAILRGQSYRTRAVEGEIAFRLGADLPARAEPYSREEVIAAVAGSHAAIEVLETAFAEPDRVDPLSRLADLQMHGGLVAGAAAPGWADVDAAREKVTLVVDGAVRYEGAGANPAGADLPGLLVWLANHGAARTGGLEAGQWITTGNWTGKNLAGPESEVLVRFRHLGEAVLRFSARP